MASSHPRVLWLGRPIKYATEFFREFESSVDIVVKRETGRDEFIQALKRGDYGQFDAVLKPMVEFGVEWGRWDADIVNLLPPSTKLIAAGGAGYDWIDIDAVTERKILFCNSRGAGDEATSDHSVWLILATFRLSTYSELATRSGDAQRWKDQNQYVMDNAINPNGRILGCVGLGAIAKRTAAKARVFGLKIHYYDVVRAPNTTEAELQATFHDTIESLLKAGPDCINVSVPYMDSTHHLIDAKFLAAMKPGSRLVNTARGKVVHEAALVDALKSGQILSAGLDVHYDEPRVHPELIANPNVTLTGHIGGVTQDTHAEFERLSMTNVLRVLVTKEEPLTPVNRV